MKNGRFSIFGHALGIHLAERILQKQKNDSLYQEFIARYLRVKFSGTIPTLLDYEKCVLQYQWMLPPDDNSHRLDHKMVKQQIDDFKSRNIFGITKRLILVSDIKKTKSFTGFHHMDRQPCNLD